MVQNCHHKPILCIVTLQSPVLRGISGEGLAKLLLSRRVISQKQLARLLVLWVDPSTDEEARLRAVLGIFFSAVASSDRYSTSPWSLCMYKVLKRGC